MDEAKVAEILMGQTDMLRDLNTRLAIEQTVVSGIVAYMSNRGLLDDVFIAGLRVSAKDANVAPMFKETFPAFFEERIKVLEGTIAKCAQKAGE